MMPIPLPHERVDHADTEHPEDSNHHDIQEETEEGKYFRHFLDQVQLTVKGSSIRGTLT